MVKFSAALATIIVLATSVIAAPTGPFTGPATWTYEGIGACGVNSKDTDLVVGVSQQFFNAWPGYNGKNPNKNPICGRKIKATYKGKSVTATVVDSNPGAPKYRLNFSPAAFDKLVNRDLGTIQGITWSVL